MAEDSLKDFLRQQARGLDSLLELMPAKHMFAEDNSDQWQRKKQTPEQKKAARLAKMDPANWKSVKDVYDERSAEAAKKRKREQGDDGEVENNVENGQEPPTKKQKIAKQPKVLSDKKITEIGDDETIQNPNLKKKLKKRKHRVEKNQKERERREARANAEEATTSIPEKVEVTTKVDTNSNGEIPMTKSNKKKDKRAKLIESTPLDVPLKSEKPIKKVDAPSSPTEESSEDEDAAADDTMDLADEVDSEAASDVDVGIDDEDQSADEDEDEEISDEVSTATESEDVPDILSPMHDSASSSVSSIQPPTQKLSRVKPASESESSKPIQSESEREAARQRLQSQISQFRSQRKADSKPVQTRAELLEQRRRKEAERKAAKKEQRRKEKEEEARKQDEEIARRFSPGGSVTGSLLGSPRSPMIDDDSGANAFTFGRIAFADGSSFDPTSKTATDAKKRKGPADAATALKAAQAKQGRIAGLDDERKADIAEKDMWLNARKRAHGEKVRDDTSLLKKALKRQDKEKKKSEKEWTKRTEGVQASVEAKQKRRTENLQKRKDEKGTKKGKKPKRAGFEGSFKGRSGKNKK